MQGPRETKKEEFNEVINLINNVFRLSRGCKPTMQEEFPLLLNYNNCDNMRIIVEDGIPAADVNFLNQDIKIEDSIVKEASIGAVCTNEKYRKKGYSSLILDDVENKMYSDNIDIVLISGERELYKRRGCVLVNNFYEYTIKPHKIEMDIEIEEYKPRFLEDMFSIYNENLTRYLRTYEEFEMLLKAATIPWGKFTYKKYVFIKNNKLVGYLVLRIINENIKHGQVIEYSGNVDILYDSLSNISYELGLDYIKYHVHIKDDKNKLDKYDKKELTNLHGTIKIINFVNLMENLKQYFIKHVPKHIIDTIGFKQENEVYYIQINDEVLVINDVKTITRLVFEGADGCELKLEDKPNIKSFIDKVFPVHFVWSANLNYQ